MQEKKKAGFRTPSCPAPYSIGSRLVLAKEGWNFHFIVIIRQRTSGGKSARLVTQVRPLFECLAEKAHGSLER